MDKKRWNSLVFLALFCMKAFSHSPNASWNTTIGGSLEDYLAVIYPTRDGGYIAGGYSYSGVSGVKTTTNNGDADYWIVKINPDSTIAWQKSFGGSGADILTSLQVTFDGGFILGGYSTSGISGDKTQPSHGLEDYWILKVDALGNKEWDKTFGGNGSDKLSKLIQTGEGGYLLGGQSNSAISGDKSQASNGLNDYWVVKINADGTTIEWNKVFGGTSDEVLSSLLQDFDGNYILGGYSFSGISGNKSEASKGMADYWVVKANSVGAIIWDKAIGGTSSDTLTNMIQLFDGALLLGGYTLSDIGGDKTDDSDSTDIWLVKLNNTNSQILWDTTITNYGIDRLSALVQNSVGRFLLGASSEDGTGVFSWKVMYFDSYFTTMVWGFQISGVSGDVILSDLHETFDQQIIIAGYSNSNGDPFGENHYKANNTFGGNDFFVMLNDGAGINKVQNSISDLCQASKFNVVIEHGGIGFKEGNVFTVQLSDSQGSFLSPTVLATKTLTDVLATNDTIFDVVTPNITGLQFKIRVVSTLPQLISLDNTSDIAIYPIPLDPICANSGPVNEGQNITLTCSSVAGASYTWLGPNDFISNNQNPIFLNTLPSISGTYSVNITVNGCVSNFSETGVVINSLVPTASSNGPVCEEDTLKLFAVDVIGATYAWSGPDGFVSTSQNPFIANAMPIATGTYVVTASLGGNDYQSSIYATVNAKPPKPIIVVAGPNLVSSKPNGNQWAEVTESGIIDIAGATSQQYAPTLDGSYVVTYTDGNGCSATSDPKTFVGTYIIDVEEKYFSVYPNPFQNLITIEQNLEHDKSAIIRLVDVYGRILVQEKITNSSRYTLNAEKYSNGVYSIQIDTETSSSIFRVIKQN